MDHQRQAHLVVGGFRLIWETGGQRRSATTVRRLRERVEALAGALKSFTGADPGDRRALQIRSACDDIWSWLRGDNGVDARRYGIRPYVPRSCCFDTVPALPDAGVAGSADLVLLTAYSPMPPTVCLTVTFRDQRQFQGYRAGLVQLVDAALVLLLRVLVMLLAAFAHRTTAPVYLLVLLSSVRHYGHRSEPDHQSLSALALIFQRGSARLAA